MIRRLSAVAALMFASSAAFAGTAIDAVNNQARASIAIQHLDYSEIDNYGVTSDGKLDSERGSQPGVAVSVTMQRDIAGVQKVYFAAELGRLKGRTDYDGYLQGGGALVPYKSKTDDTTTDFQVKLGKGFQFGTFNQAQVTPYVAVGSYNWLRDMSSDQYGYTERYKHKFVAIGALAQYEFTPRLVGSVDYQYGRTHNATMTLVDSGTEYALGSKAIQTVDIGVDYAVQQNVHAHAGYRFNKFSYGQSDVIDGALEPSSNTKRNEVTFGVGYSF